MQFLLGYSPIVPPGRSSIIPAAQDDRMTYSNAIGPNSSQWLPTIAVNLKVWQFYFSFLNILVFRTFRSLHFAFCLLALLFLVSFHNYLFSSSLSLC